ncbi:MAG: UDP-glucose/GDP-mannose dehydrogenase family protein [Pseudomonadota bacterium]
MNLTMIGAGYVGLVSGACFADFGWRVTCVDRDADRIAALEAGEIPIYEPGLDALVARTASQDLLRFTTDMAATVAAADVIFLAVGTPSRRGDGHADLSFIFDAVRELASHLEGFTVLVVKSTVPVGTGDRIEEILRETAPDADVAVVSNPEFLREGAAIEDFKRPDRVVIGVECPRAREVMQRIYRPLSLNQAPIFMTDRKSSELIKYASNAFLAMKITFINEMANLCEKVGADIQEVARGIGADGRIGSKFLHAGPGYGGSCFPKDTLALVKTAQDNEAPSRLIETVVAVNTDRQRAMVRKVIEACGGSVLNRTVSVLGLTFKPNTDDMRDSPAIPLIVALQDAGARCRVYDPEGMENAREVIDDVTYCDSALECLDGGDVMVLVTEWDAFRGISPDAIKARLTAPVVVDLRNVFRPDEMRARGFTYISVGRP